MSSATISSFARAQSRERFKRVLKEVHHASGHLENPDAIHDLRVSIRRFRQCLRTFRGLYGPHPLKKFKKRLRILMDLCGNVRSCDVALELLPEAGVPAGPSAAKIGAARKRALETLRSHLKKERRRKTPDWRACWHASVKEGSSWDRNQSVGANARRVLPPLAKDFFEAGAAAAAHATNYRALHQFRLRAKRFRYALELFRNVFEHEMESGLEVLKGLQDRLGAINDCVATIELIRQDRSTTSAVRKLLHRRGEEFAEYWRVQFPPRRLKWWQSWLGTADL